MGKYTKPLVQPVDPFEEKKWINLFTCFSPLKDNLYMLYKCIAVLFFIFINCTALYTVYLVSSDKAMAADVLHIYTCTVWHLWTVGSRYITDRSLMRMREMIKSGIYIYEEEDLEHEQLNKLRSIKKDVLSKSNKFILATFVGLFFVAVVFPLCQYLTASGKEKEQLINPYLPHPVYYPFNTETPHGFALAYVVDMLYWVYLYCTAVLSTDLLIYSTVHLKVHFFILNYSITNIHKRAYKLFARNNNHKIEEASFNELKQCREFQICLRTCLKANIRHHQTLLRFRNACQPYNGLSLLIMTTVVVIIYAAVLFLLLQNIPIILKIKYAGTFLVEQNYSFLICYLGQEVTTESSAVFKSLYSTSWMYYDKDFKQTLHIMMSNTISPMVIKAYLLDFSATLQSFSELQSAVYKIMNLWRQSDKIK